MGSRSAGGEARVTAALAAVLAVGAALTSPGPAAAQETSGEFELSGGIYLFHHQPVDLAGADDLTEVYALYLDLDRTDGPWTIHVQGRWRDTKLRSFFPSNTWLQEAWVAYEVPVASRREASHGEPDAGPPATLTLRAGKVYGRLGRFWDGSFFGNVHYFDGLKLDPEFGAEALLSAPLGPAGSRVELHLQGLVDSDRVNGALPGRDLEGEGDLGEGGMAAGLRVSAPLGTAGGRGLRGAAGISGLVERIEPEGRPTAPEATLEHLALDVELSWEDAGLVYLEWTRRASGGPGELDGVLPSPGTGVRGPAGSRATWWLAGARATFGPVDVRYNLSTAEYDDGGFREWIHQPGITWHPAESVALLVEYDDWRRDPSGPPPAPADELPPREVRLDRSLNVVLLLTF